MSHRLTPLLGHLGMNEWLLQSVFVAATQDVATRRIATGTNTLQGIAAHVVMSRHSLCRLLELPVGDLPWTDLGEAVEAGFVERDDFPTLETMQEAWNAMIPKLRAGLTSVPDAVLNKPSPFPIPGIEKPTLGDFAPLDVLHETYHIGQLGLMVKAFTGQGIMTPPAGD